MNELITHIWNYEAILAHAAAGNQVAAAEVAASALLQCNAMLADFEARFEDAAAAEAAWLEGGAQLMADLNAEDLLF